MKIFLKFLKIIFFFQIILNYELIARNFDDDNNSGLNLPKLSETITTMNSLTIQLWYNKFLI